MLAMDWADQQSEAECYEMRACRDHLARLEAIEGEGVIGLNTAICKLRDQIITMMPSTLRNSSMVFECLMRDPETFDNCDNEALRKIFLEFAIEVHYFGESFRVSVGHLN